MFENATFANTTYFNIHFISVSQLLRFVVYESWVVDPMNELMQQSVEFGLLTYFDRRTKRLMHVRDLSQLGKHNELSISRISMKELHFLFILYGFGILISITVLIGEILISKYRKFRRDFMELLDFVFLRTM